MTQLALGFGHREALDAEDFLVAPSNREAVLWLDRWPDWPAPALAIHGPPGCGKTHLTHVWQARSGARGLTLRSLAGVAPHALLGDGACAAIDGADDGPLDERALLHLYNVVAERGGHLLLTAHTPPARWPIGLADLRSRLGAAPAVTVRAPDDALIGALMVKQFADRQLRVAGEVIDFLLPRMERSFDAARRLVAALDDAALAGRRNITVPLARRVLEELESDRKGETPWTLD
ncbi:MAG: DNA replication protein [Alphaproteobacteria bacterium]